MPTTWVDSDLVVVCFWFPYLLSQGCLGCVDFGEAHNHVVVSDRHTVRHLVLHSSQDHVWRFELGWMRIVLCVDERCAATFLCSLCTEFRASITTPAETSNTKFTSSGDVLFHRASELQLGRVCLFHAS